jgi:hypothetical protein
VTSDCVPPFARPLPVMSGCCGGRTDELLAALATVMAYVDAHAAHLHQPTNAAYYAKIQAHDVMVTALASYREGVCQGSR